MLDIWHVIPRGVKTYHLRTSAFSPQESLFCASQTGHGFQPVSPKMSSFSKLYHHLLNWCMHQSRVSARLLPGLLQRWQRHKKKDYRQGPRGRLKPCHRHADSMVLCTILSIMRIMLATSLSIRMAFPSTFSVCVNYVNSPKIYFSLWHKMSLPLVIL